MSRFDKEIKDKLEGYASPVNSDMWSKISSNLPPQEQADPKTWWLPIVGVTAVLIGAFSLFLLGDFSLDHSSTPIQTAQTTASEVVTEEDMTLNSSSSEDIAKESKKSMKIDLQNGLNDENNVGDIKNQVVAQDIIVDNKEVQENIQSSLNFQNQNSSDEARASQTLTSNANSTTANTAELNIDNEIDEDKISDESASLYKQYNAIINKTRELKGKNLSKMVERSEEIFIAPLQIEEVSSLESAHKFSLPKEKLICPSFNNLRFGVFVEAFYSNDFGMRALSYNGPVGDVDYLNIRNDTEQANYSFSTGARVSFMLPSGFGAKTGINYSQINETFKFEDPESKQTKKVIIKEYQWENGVVVDSTEVTKEIEIPGRLTVINQNRYRILDLPLLFTYEWGHKKRLYYSVTAGPMFNIRFTQRGKFLDPETLSPVDFSSDSGNYKAFTTNIGTSMFMSFALNYQLGNGLDVFVEPNLRYFLKDATVNTYLLNQRYTVLGLGMGVKYKL